MSKNIQALIKAHRFFEGMKDTDIDALTNCGNLKTYPAESFIGRENQPASEFFAILDGRVAIETYLPGKKSVVLQTMQSGDVVGWSWLFSPHQWVFDARAQTEIRVIAFDGACLRTTCEHNPTLGFELMKRIARVMTSRLKATRLQLLDLYGHKDKERTFGIGS